VRADHPTAVVEELVADHHDVVYAAAGVDDPVPGGEGARRPPNLVERGGDLSVVLRVLVRQHQIRRGLHRAGLVPVHPLDLRRPLPPFVGEIEPEPTDPMGVSPSESLLNGRLPLGLSQLVGHAVKTNRRTARSAWERLRSSG
jgi:hypothetical protein